MAHMRLLIGTMLAMGLGFSVAGCGFSLAPLPAGSIAGRAGIYDYSPSVIQSGNLQQSWWCGGAYNPPGTTYFSDTIQYQSINMSTGVQDGPMTVLGETPGAWVFRFHLQSKGRWELFRRSAEHWRELYLRHVLRRPRLRP